MFQDSLAELAEAVGRVVGRRALLIVNGPPAVAVATAADGVQLSERNRDVATAKAKLGAERLVGRLHLRSVLGQRETDGLEFPEGITQGFTTALRTGVDVVVGLTSVLMKMGRSSKLRLVTTGSSRS